MDFAVLALVIFAGGFVVSRISATVMGVLPASISSNAWAASLVNAALLAGVVVLAAKSGLGSKIRAAV